MKYQNQDAFEKANMFGTGTPNTAYAQYFIGNSFLNPLTDPKGGLFAGLPQQLAHPSRRKGRRAAFAVHRR